MKACKVSIMASREKARSTPCEPLEIEVKSHKVIRQSSVKTLNKCTKIGKLEKGDWTAFSYAWKSHSPRSPRQPHHRLPGTRARRPTRCHRGSEMALHLPSEPTLMAARCSIFIWHYSARALQQCCALSRFIALLPICLSTQNLAWVQGLTQAFGTSSSIVSWTQIPTTAALSVIG